MTIKSANELKEKIENRQMRISKGIAYDFERMRLVWEQQIIKFKKEAKEKLKELGCGKYYVHTNENGNWDVPCGNYCQRKMWLCPKCQEEKEILEDILK